jgi:exodeoxyribonuclease VII small subunit
MNARKTTTRKAPAGKAREAELGFTAAIRELEEILGRVEGEDVDLDRLAEELKRAADLLDLCRAKIRKADLEVGQIVQKLESPDDEE